MKQLFLFSREEEEDIEVRVMIARQYAAANYFADLMAQDMLAGKTPFYESPVDWETCPIKTRSKRVACWRRR